MPNLTRSAQVDPTPTRALDMQMEVPVAWGVVRRYWQLLFVSAVVLMLYAPVIKGLFVNWYEDPDYSQGFFVPMLSTYMVWRKRDELFGLSARPRWHGLFIVGGSRGLFLGSLGAELFLTRIAFLGTIAGLIVYFLGWSALRAVSFPMGFLLLMIPLPALVYNEIVFPLQSLASSFAAYWGNVLPLSSAADAQSLKSTESILTWSDQACIPRWARFALVYLYSASYRSFLPVPAAAAESLQVRTKSTPMVPCQYNSPGVHWPLHPSDLPTRQL